MNYVSVETKDALGVKMWPALVMTRPVRSLLSVPAVSEHLRSVEVTFSFILLCGSFSGEMW